MLHQPAPTMRAAPTLGDEASQTRKRPPPGPYAACPIYCMQIDGYGFSHNGRPFDPFIPQKPLKARYMPEYAPTESAATPARHRRGVAPPTAPRRLELNDFRRLVRRTMNHVPSDETTIRAWFSAIDATTRDGITLVDFFVFAAREEQAREQV